MSRMYIITLLIELLWRVHQWNAGLDEDQTRIKNAKRNINNLEYEHDTTLMAESK